MKRRIKAAQYNGICYKKSDAVFLCPGNGVSL